MLTSFRQEANNLPRVQAPVQAAGQEPESKANEPELRALQRKNQQLKIQLETALRTAKMRDSDTNIEITELTRELQSKQEEAEAAKQELSRVQQENEQLTKKSEETLTKFNEYKEKLIARLRDLRRELERGSTEQNILKQTITNLNKQLQQAKKRKDPKITMQDDTKLNQKIIDLEEKLEQSQQMIVKKKQDLILLQQLEQQYITKINSLENSIENLVREKERDVRNVQIEFKDQFKEAQKDQVKKFDDLLKVKQEEEKKFRLERVQMKSELDTLKLARDGLSTEIKNLRDKIASKTQELQQASKSLNNITEQSEENIQQLNEMYETEKAQIQADHETQTKSFQGLVAKLRSENTTIKENKEKYMKNLEAKTVELGAIQTELAKKEAELNKINQTVAQNTVTIAQLEQQIDPLKTKLNQIEIDRNVAQKSLAAFTNEQRTEKRALERLIKLNTLLTEQKENLTKDITGLQSELEKVKQSKNTEAEELRVIVQRLKLEATDLKTKLTQKTQELKQKAKELQKKTSEYVQAQQDLFNNANTDPDIESKFTSQAPGTDKNILSAADTPVTVLNQKVSGSDTKTHKSPVSTGNQDRSVFEKKYTKEGGNSTLQSVVFSPDGEKIAFIDTTTPDKNNILKLWNFQNQTSNNIKTADLDNLTGISNVAFARYNHNDEITDSMATYSLVSNIVVFWKDSSNSNRLSADRRNLNIYDLTSGAYSNDGMIFAAGTADGFLKVYNRSISDGKLTQIYDGQSLDTYENLEKVVISKKLKNGQYKVAVVVKYEPVTFDISASSKWKIKCYQINLNAAEEREKVILLQKYILKNRQPTSVAFSADGALLAVATSNRVRIYNSNTFNSNKILVTRNTKTISVAFLASQDQDQKEQESVEALVIFSNTKCSLWYYNNTEEINNTLVDIVGGTASQENTRFSAGAVSQDGKHIAIAFKPKLSSGWPSQQSVVSSSKIEVYSRS